jgi:hypothetical protein
MCLRLRADFSARAEMMALAGMLAQVRLAGFACFVLVIY